MKKLIALLAVCGFAFAFAACGKKENTDTTATDVDSSAIQTEEVIVDSSATYSDTTVVTDTTAAQ